MTGSSGLTRGRVLLIVGGVLVLAVLAGVWRWGDGAVELDEGALNSIPTTARGAWAGFDVRNDGDFPVTLTEFRPGALDNAEIVRAVVVQPQRNQGWYLAPVPLSTGPQAVVAAGRSVDGFVLPPHSVPGQYTIAVLFRPVRSTRTASITGGTIAYSSITGIGHTARGGLVVCLRAAGACP